MYGSSGSPITEIIYWEVGEGEGEGREVTSPKGSSLDSCDASQVVQW